MNTKFQRGDCVTYSTSNGAVEGIVRRVHRDGDYTVEARHHLNTAGEPVGAYLGFKFRMDPAELRACP